MGERVIGRFKDFKEGKEERLSKCNKVCNIGTSEVISSLKTLQSMSLTVAVAVALEVEFGVKILFGCKSRNST